MFLVYSTVHLMQLTHKIKNAQDEQKQKVFVQYVKLCVNEQQKASIL